MGYMQEFKAHWPTLIAASIGLAFGAALNHYASNLFGPALLADFGWQKSDLALTGVMAVMTMGFVPLAGRFTDRFGARTAATVGFSVVAATYYAYSIMSGALWQYFAITAVHMLFAVLTTTIVFARIIVERFDAARGMALSIIVSGPPLAAALLMPVLDGIITSSGWRSGYQAMALLTLVAGTLAIALIGTGRADGVVAKVRPRMTWADFTLLGKHPAFLLLVGGMFLVNIPQILVAGQLNIMLLENGAPERLAAWIVSLYAIGVIIGRFVSGLALDRFAAHFVALFALGLPALGYCALALPYDPAWLLTGSILLVGLAQGAEGDLGAFIASRAFGVQHFSFVYSFLILSIGIANAAGSALLSLTLARTDRFETFLIICAVATALGTAAFVLTGRKAKVEEATTA